jgi:son of sevenless-like protein
MHAPKYNADSDTLISIDLDDMTVTPLSDRDHRKFSICLQNFSGDQTSIVSGYNQMGKDNWLSALRDILDIKFFNESWNRKIIENIQEHVSDKNDLAQEYYAYELETLYSNTMEDEPDAPQNIEYNNTNEITSATLNKLLFKLAHPTEHDNNFLYTFMLTYKSFISTEDLLEFLIKRWNTPPPRDVDFQIFKETFLFPVRLRIAQILSYWVEFHFYNFRDQIALQTLLTNFIAEQIRKTKMEVAADRLMISTRSKNRQRDTFSHQQQERQKAQLQILQELIAKTDQKTANSTAITLMGSITQNIQTRSGSELRSPSSARVMRTRTPTKLGQLVNFYDQMDKDSRKVRSLFISNKYRILDF